MKEKEEEFDLSFDDPTMLETDGMYEAVKQLMLEEDVPPHKWMIPTKLVLTSMSGVGEFDLNFFNDGLIYITNYKPSQSDIFYNTDLPVLATWAQESGWKMPRPHPDLIRAKYGFWHHFWEAGIVESEYLDQLCGWKNK